MKNPRRILIITLSNLGDIILTLPVIRAIEEKYPAAVIDIAGGSPLEEILAQDKSVNNIIILRKHRGLKQRLNFLRELKRGKYDLVIDLKHSFLSFFLTPGRFIANALKILIKGKNNRTIDHKVNEHLKEIQFLGIKKNTVEFNIPVDDVTVCRVKELVGNIDDQPFIVVAPGSRSHLKRWPCDKYIELCGLIRRELGLCIVIVGDDNDREVASKISLSEDGDLVNVCGSTSVLETMKIIKKAACIISADSAPVHMASAAGIPAVALFGPTDEKKYGPISDGSVVITTNEDCRPCEKALCLRGMDPGCMPSIEVKEVFEAVKKIMDRGMGNVA